MRGARRRSVEKCPVCGAPLAVPPPRVERAHRRCAVALAPARCLAARVHQPAAQIELALDPAQLPLRSVAHPLGKGSKACQCACSGLERRSTAGRGGLERSRVLHSLVGDVEVSLVTMLSFDASMCLSACMNSRASGARCHKRRIGIAGMPEARSGQRGGKTGDDGVSRRLIPVRQYVTKHLFPAHCARDRTEKCRHRK